MDTNEAAALPQDAAGRWVALRKEATEAGYSHFGVDGGTDGWLDLIGQVIYTDAELDVADELRQLERLVGEMRRTLAAPMSAEVRFVSRVADLEVGQLLAVLDGLGSAVGKSEIELIRHAAVASLRRRLPGAFSEVDDVHPESGEDVAALVRAARDRHARASEEDDRELCSAGGWHRLRAGELRVSRCGEERWAPHAGRDDRGASRLGYVTEQCRVEAPWSRGDGPPAALTLRCTLHAARTVRRERAAGGRTGPEDETENRRP
jgi:hypothetical protein